MMGPTVSITPGREEVALARCPSGKIAIGGRYMLLEEKIDVYSDAAVQIPDLGNDDWNEYWKVRVRNVSNKVVRVRAWANCAKVGQ
ncbi:hypothetical protein AB0O28_20565 [Microbispora sp. NPDC088329]|uniref:hypothetical protein n=1 Tax=Microbispora sp. NPDC088329 TaxID=3154869 RepID=UPI003415FF0A